MPDGTESAMRWAVAYYEGNLPLAWRDSDSFSWSALPTGDGVTSGIAWVDVTRGIYTQTLAGMDYYWVSPDGRFGSFNDPDNYAMYGGGLEAQYKAYLWDGDGFKPADPTVPNDAHVLIGIMLPDDEWRALRGY